MPVKMTSSVCKIYTLDGLMFSLSTRNPSYYFPIDVREKEMHYLNGRKEGNILFNDALNTLFTVIWHQTYGKGPHR